MALMRAAEQLGELTDRLVFVGGGVVDVLVSDPNSPPARPTIDVDVIADIEALVDYYKLGALLKARGFGEVVEGNVICRWRCGDLILDVMPTSEEVFGFGNRWYQSALEYSIRVVLPNGGPISVIDQAHFIATKLEAFASRGKQDIFVSHDFEDIVAVVNGFPELVDQVAHSTPDLRGYLCQWFNQLLKRSDLPDAIEGHLAAIHDSNQRSAVVLQRFALIAKLETGS